MIVKANTKSIMFNDRQIEIIEEHYGVKYVFESQLWSKETEHWTDAVAVIFYQESPNIKLGHSHWMGVYRNKINKHFVINAAPTILHPIAAVLSCDGEYTYSHHRHHFCQKNDIAIDGGRDYTRLVGNNIPDIVHLYATKDGLELRENNNEHSG